MDYVTLQDCEERLFAIAIEFDSSEKTPAYASNKKGMDALEGILERVQASWYEGVIAKAAYLAVAINKGHLFMNGNKRLSLIITLDFLYRNGFHKHKSLTRMAYTRWFQREFPDVFYSGFCSPKAKEAYSEMQNFF